MFDKHKKKSDCAIVGVVTAILLIGLAAAIISLVQTIYVPKIMEQREAEHMDDVADQFTRLKYAIDSQVTSANPELPIVTSITLGSKELPYLLSVRAFGSLDILSNVFSITLVDNNPGTEDPELKYGTIRYSSVNAYFIDQDYTYESGSVIISQEDGYKALSKPLFSVVYDDTPDDPSFTIKNIVDIVGVGEKNSSAGYGNIPIQSEYVDSVIQPEITDVQEIVITTSFSEAWELFVENAFEKAGLVESDYSIVDNPDGIEISFTSPVDVTIESIRINAQIGPGFIE